MFGACCRYCVSVLRSVLRFEFSLGEADLVLEPPVPRLEFSQFLVVLPLWILALTQKVFDERHVRLQDLY
jgi:hypothetical protein